MEGVLIFVGFCAPCIVVAIILCARNSMRRESDSNSGEGIVVNLPVSPRTSKRKQGRRSRASKRASAKLIAAGEHAQYEEAGGTRRIKTMADLEEEYRQAQENERRSAPPLRSSSNGSITAAPPPPPPYARPHVRVLARESSDDEMIATYGHLKLRTLSLSSTSSARNGNAAEVYDDTSAAFAGFV